MNDNGKRFHFSPFGLLVMGAILYVGANMALDSYREHRAEVEVAKVLNSPGVANAQLAQIAEETQTLCIAKGHTEDWCKQFLSH